LDLTLCKNKKAEISIPVSINGNIDKFNSSGGYYNDICYKTKSDYNTDICLDDRRNEFINKNLTLCEEDCNLIDYDYINEKAKCSCVIKLNLFYPLKEVKFDKERLKNNFIDINNIANVQFMKCYKIAFKKDNIKSNYGFYILGFIIILFFICFFLFCFKFYDLFKRKIKEIMSFIKKDNIKGKINFSDNNINEIKKDDILNIENNNIITIKKRNNKRFILNKNNSNNINMPIKEIKKFETSDNLKSINDFISYDKNKIKEDIFNKSDDNNNFYNYNDTELNSLSYEEAKKMDKRTYIQYYISLIKINHLLLFSFYPNKDYNSQLIKKFLFFFFFASHITINAFFYNDSTMHQIYEEKGTFNFIYQMPKIIYSSLISSVISVLIKYLSLSEKEIIAIKQEKKKYSKKNGNKSIKDLFKKIKIKFTFFFIVTPFFLFLFWYYITCFCGVYENTQVHLIKESIISFTMSLIYPFFISLLPGIFRIIALKDEKKKRELLYKFSKLLQLI